MTIKRKQQLIGSVDGILSNEPKDNPYLWNANHIYVPYCSSDSWSGFAPANSSDQQHPFAFMGSKILERVLESLYDDQARNSSLFEAKFILLAGDSAGATGVILNLDKVAGLIERRSSSSSSQRCGTGNKTGRLVDSSTTLQAAELCETKQAPVLRGLADSGWFLDNEPYDYGRHEINSYGGELAEQSHNQAQSFNEQRQLDCDRARCTPSQSIRQAMHLWNGQVPEACASAHLDEPWRCYFGYRVYQTLKTPLFVVQWLYDEAQLMVDNIARPDTSGQWNYVNKVVNEMRVSLENVTALFAPSCFSHSLITRRSWNQININGFKLPHVLNSWEEQSLIYTSTDSPPPPTMRLEQSPKLAAADFSNAAAYEQAAASLMGVELLPIQISDDSNRQQVVGENNGELVRRNNISSSLGSSLVSQPTFETLLVRSSNPPNKPFIDNARSAPRELPAAHELQRSNLANRTNTPQASSRLRNRKRRRNNNQQGHQKAKQTRQRAHLQQADLSQQATSGQLEPSPVVNNDLSLQSQNPLQDLLPLIDQSLASEQLFNRLNREPARGSSNSFGRLGRSTLVDDATLMLSNNMPDDNLATTSTQSPNSQMSSSNKYVAPVIEHKWTIWPTTDSQLASTETFKSSVSQAASNHQHHHHKFRLIDSCGWPQCNRDCPILDSDFNSAGFIQF